jgi:hypothetical protein
MRRTRHNTPTAFWVDRVYRFARNEEIDLDELRTRLRKMTDEDLLCFGKAARFVVRKESRRRERCLKEVQ